MKLKQRISANFVLLVSALICNSSWATPVEPIADAAGPYFGTVGVAVEFDGSGSSHPFDPLEYLWNFGDGGTSNLMSPLYTYSTPDLYTVTLTVEDLSGVTASATTSADISSVPIPAAAWLFGSGLLGLIGMARRVSR